MSLFAISILLVSAVLHTAWNLLIKQAEDKYIVTFWMVTFGGVFALFALFFTGLPPRGMWLFAVISVCVEVVYFITLSYAYHDNDFSLVYPIARGAAPAFIALWAFLFLREKLTTGGVTGLALIIGGLVVIGVNALTQAHVTRVHFKGVAVALFIAFLISIYSTIDGSAVKNGYAMPYVMTMFALVPFVISVFAYSIAPLSYAGAVREVSVVFGALTGWWLLNEKLGGVRVFGAFVIFAGVLMIAVFG